jgi:hypothetical protein
LKFNQATYLKNTYVYLFLNLFFLVINNYFYLPQYRLEGAVQLANMSSFSTADGILALNPVNDVKLVQLWVSESNIFSNKQLKNCEKLRDLDYYDMKITGIKGVQNIVQISILGSDADFIKYCYFEIINSINTYQYNSYNDRLKSFILKNYSYIPASSISKITDNPLTRDNYFKKIFNILLSIFLAFQLIFIIKTKLTV